MARLGLDRVGGRLRHLRLAHGLKQGELARRAGLSRAATISDLERGEYEPSDETIYAIGNALGNREAVVAYLLGRGPMPERGSGIVTMNGGYSGEPSIPRRVVREAVGRAWDIVADGAQAGRTVPGEVVALAFGRLTRELALTPPSDNGAGLPHARAAGD